LSTITETSGSSIYWVSDFLMSSASWAGVLPTAGMSVISGVVMRPSGRTCTFAPSSGLRHTKTVSSSSAPMMYFSLTSSSVLTKEAAGSVLPVVEAVVQPARAARRR
jgi:hypothetical protein